MHLLHLAGVGETAGAAAKDVGDWIYEAEISDDPREAPGAGALHTGAADDATWPAESVPA